MTKKHEAIKARHWQAMETKVPSISAKKRMARVLDKLVKLYPERGTSLKFNSVFQLAVATILSSQCTDARVNIVTNKLFKKINTPKGFATADLHSLEKLIYSTGFYHTKAKNIKAMAKAIVEMRGGVVPKKMGDLIKLPGIGRKTANIILSEGHGIVEGIAVDTHVKRLSLRLGFTKSNSPEKIEKDLLAVVPKESWGEVNGLLIMHGRKVCTARKPKCHECELGIICPKNGLTAE